MNNNNNQIKKIYNLSQWLKLNTIGKAERKHGLIGRNFKRHNASYEFVGGHLFNPLTQAQQDQLNKLFKSCDTYKLMHVMEHVKFMHLNKLYNKHMQALLMQVELLARYIFNINLIGPFALNNASYEINGITVKIKDYENSYNISSLCMDLKAYFSGVVCNVGYWINSKYSDFKRFECLFQFNLINPKIISILPRYHINQLNLFTDWMHKINTDFFNSCTDETTRAMFYNNRINAVQIINGGNIDYCNNLEDWYK